MYSRQNKIGVYKLLILRYYNNNIRFFTLAPSKLIALVIAIAGMQLLSFIGYSDMFSFSVCLCNICMGSNTEKKQETNV